MTESYVTSQEAMQIVNIFILFLELFHTYMQFIHPLTVCSASMMTLINNIMHCFITPVHVFKSLMDRNKNSICHYS